MVRKVSKKRMMKSFGMTMKIKNFLSRVYVHTYTRERVRVIFNFNN